MDKEMKIVMEDVKNSGFGVLDTKTKKRIDVTRLALFWEGERKVEVKRLFVLCKDLAAIEEIYKKKFPYECPYDLKLFEKDPGLFVERLIRATEICTMKYVLNRGGVLNKGIDSTIIKGRKKFVWEY